jgi:L-lactate dehydrogenase
VRSILRDEDAILTISSLMEDHYGIEDISLSLPTIINGSGVEKVLNLPLDDTEEKDFIKSADTLKNIAKDLDI